MKYRRVKGQYWDGKTTDYDGQEVYTDLYAWIPEESAKVYSVVTVRVGEKDIPIRIMALDTLTIEAYLLPFIQNQEGL